MGPGGRYIEKKWNIKSETSTLGEHDTLGMVGIGVVDPGICNWQYSKFTMMK